MRRDGSRIGGRLRLGEVVVVEDDEFWIEAFGGTGEGAFDELVGEFVSDEAVDSGAFQNGFGVSDLGAVWLGEDRFHGVTVPLDEFSARWDGSGARGSLDVRGGTISFMVESQFVL